jgi:NADPH:quinone reductase
MIQFERHGQAFSCIIELLAPEGRFGLIDDPPSLDAVPLKSKAAWLHWEFMFARPLLQHQA